MPQDAEKATNNGKIRGYPCLKHSTWVSKYQITQSVISRRCHTRRVRPIPYGRRHLCFAGVPMFSSPLCFELHCVPSDTDVLRRPELLQCEIQRSCIWRNYIDHFQLSHRLNTVTTYITTLDSSEPLVTSHNSHDLWHDLFLPIYVTPPRLLFNVL